MPSGRISKSNQVWLNGQTYSIVGDVKTDLISHQPPKVSIGPFTKDDNPIASTITWADFRGGLGKEIITSDEDYHRTFYSTIPTHTVPLAFGLKSTFPCPTDHGDEPRFFMPGTSSHFYTGTSTAFLKYLSTNMGTNVGITTFGTAITDSTWGFLSSAAASTTLVATQLLAVGAGGLAYRGGGSSLDFATTTFSTNAGNAISYVTIYKNQVYGLNSSNDLLNTLSPGSTWTVVAHLQVPNPDVTGLIVGPAPDGPQNALYVVSRQGLHLYDDENESFIHIPVALNPSPVAGKGVVAWQDSIYYAAGLGVYKYTPAAGTVQSVGLDKNDSLPLIRAGSINSLVVGGRYLFAQVHNNDVTGMEDAIYRYYNGAWDQVYRTSAFTTDARLVTRMITIPTIHTSDDNKTARLVFAKAGSEIFYNIPSNFDGRAALSSVGTIQQAGASTLGDEVLLPWVQKDADQNWTALEFQVSVESVKSSVSVQAFYGLDFSSTLTSFGTTTSAGVLRLNMTTAATTNDAQGIAFDAIRFQLFVKSSNNNTIGGSSAGPAAVVNRMTFVFKKSFRPIYAYSFMIDATDQNNGISPRETREKLEALGNSSLLFEFTYLDALDTSNVAENKWVSLQELQSAQETGTHESGKFVVTVAEAL